MINRIIQGVVNLVNCPKCNKKTLKKNYNSDGSIQWYCSSCGYENIIRRSNDRIRNSTKKNV
jgi:transposase-like protein